MSNYDTVLNEIFNLQQFAIKLGLENINAICRTLSDPQHSYPVIHIAGTNGKGSTAFFLAKILQAAGLRTGLYTSPHLVDFRERIRCNDILIEKSYIIRFWDEIKTLVLQRKATFFDTTTALAFNYFRDKKVDVAIIETGLGGRLDSTNIVLPEMSVITPIGFDHQKQLGRTLGLIAAEKAAIIKNNSIVVSGKQHKKALQVINEKISSTNRLYYLPDFISATVKEHMLSGSVYHLRDKLHSEKIRNLFCRQVGDFQIQNINLAYLCSRLYLNKQRNEFKSDAFRSVLKNNVWPGRLQVIQSNPNILYDVSHNHQGVLKTLRFLRSCIGEKRLIVLIGLVKDKNHREIAKHLAKYTDEIIITEPDTHRKLDAEILSGSLENFGKKSKLIKDLKEAYDLAISATKEDDTLIIIGSHYLIGAYLQFYK